MNIDNNQYDLSELFQFDLLKNILLNITTEQKKLRDELNELKTANKKNSNDNNIFKLYGLEYELNKNENKLNDEKNKKETEKNINIKGSDDNNKLNIEEIKQTININKEINPENTQLEKDKELTKKNSKDKLSNKYSDKMNKASQETYLFFVKETQTLAEKINNLENKLTNDLESQINKIETETKKNINSLLEENKSTYDKLDEQLNNLRKNNAEQDKKIENCLLKVNSVDIFNTFKDTSNGNLDAAKAMVKVLEEKVFKKFEFIDDKNKEFFENMTKLLIANDNHNMKFEKLQKGLTDIKYVDIAQVKEYFRKNLVKFERKNEDIINLLSKIEKGLSTKIFDTETKLLENLEEKEKILINNKESMNEFQNDLINIQDELETFIKKQNEINKDISKDIEEKFNMIVRKINSIETKLKQIDFTNEVKQFTQDIKEIQKTLKEKITYDNLNDLYKLQSNDAEDISNINKNMLLFQDDIKKCVLYFEKMSPKVDAFTEYLIDKKNQRKPRKDKIDINQLVTKEDYEETLKLFKRKIESIFIEIDSFKRNLDDIKLEINLCEKKDMIIKLDEQIHSDIEENKTKIQKNRNELYKQIKTLEIDIKSLWNEFKKKENSDTWILAKNSLKCFNCASCDNDVKIESPKEEHIHWKKILPSNRSYIQGKGFSHILEKMSNGLINNSEGKNEHKNDDLNQDKDIKNNSSYNINNISQIEESKIINSSDNNISILKNIAIIERNNSQPKLPIKKGRNQNNINNEKNEKMQLPQVVDMARRKAIIDTFKNINSSTDKDKVTINEYLIKNALRITSPRNSEVKKKANGKNISLNQSLKVNNP